jgi:hypothetical protein
VTRIETLNPEVYGPETNNLGLLERAGVDGSGYEKALAIRLKNRVCSGVRDAPFILCGLMRDHSYVPSRIGATGAEAPVLVEAILKPEDPKDCPVSAALTGAEKAALKKIAKEASGAP